jgi:hypothetical protein
MSLNYKNKKKNKYIYFIFKLNSIVRREKSLIKIKYIKFYNLINLILDIHQM